MKHIRQTGSEKAAIRYTRWLSKKLGRYVTYIPHYYVESLDPDDDTAILGVSYDVSY